MQSKAIRKYIGMLIFAIIVIAIYKTWNTEFIGKFFGLLTPLFVGIILAYILYFPSVRLEKLISKIPLRLVSRRARGISIVSVYIITVGIMYLVIRLLAPVLIRNIASFLSQLPAALEEFMTFLESHEFMGYSFDREVALNEIAGTISLDTILSYLNFESIVGYIRGIVNVSSAFVNALIGVIISIYLILQREEYFTLGHRLLSCIFRPEIKNEIVKYVRKVNEFIVKYIYCRVLDAVIMFFISFAALLILDTPYAIVLATIVGVFNIVPYIGSILSTIILILVSLFTEGLKDAVILGVVMFILQQIDGNIIDPYLVKDRLKINPVWVIVAVIVGGGFGGIIGIMLGVPIVAVIRLIGSELLHRREVVIEYRKRHGDNITHINYFGSQNK